MNESTQYLEDFQRKLVKQVVNDMQYKILNTFLSVKVISNIGKNRRVVIFTGLYCTWTDFNCTTYIADSILVAKPSVP
jgi:hypothetical protein